MPVSNWEIVGFSFSLLVFLFFYFPVRVASSQLALLQTPSWFCVVAGAVSTSSPLPMLRQKIVNEGDQ